MLDDEFVLPRSNQDWIDFQNEYAKYVRRWIGSRVPSHEAEDLEQEVWIKIMSKIESFKGETKGRFMSWLKVVVKNQCHNILRKSHAAKRSPADGFSDIDVNEVADKNRESTNHWEIVEVTESLLASLERLDPRVAVTFRLRYFGNLSIQKIAEVLEISQSTVACDLRMGKKILRSKSDSDGGG